MKNIPNKGYGIFACDKISKGAFICEYIGYALNIATRTSERFNVSYREIIDKNEANKREEGYIKKRFELINCLRMLNLLTLYLFFWEFTANSSCTTSMVSLDENARGTSWEEILSSSYKYLFTN